MRSNKLFLMVSGILLLCLKTTTFCMFDHKQRSMYKSTGENKVKSINERIAKIAIFLERKEIFRELKSDEAPSLLSRDRVTSGEALSLYRKKVGATIAALTDALNQDVEIVIASATLIDLLLYLNKCDRKRDIKDWPGEDPDYYRKTKDLVEKVLKTIDTWAIYKTTDEHFGIFIKKKPGRTIYLEDLGLNEYVLEPLESRISDLKATFADPSGDIGSINVGNLNRIFGKNVKKVVYVFGHGNYPSETDDWTQAKSLVAQLTHKENSSFLRRLDETGCLIVYYFSCYSAGRNLTYIHKMINELDEEGAGNVSFPIIAGGIADVEQLYFVPDLKKFYTGLENLFSPPLSYTGKPPTYGQIVKSICGDHLNNIPSILIPGVRPAIKTIADDQVLVLTYPLLLQHELKGVKIKGQTLEEREEQEEEEGEVAPSRKEILRISLSEKELNIEHKTAVLLYPMIINIPLKIAPGKTPKIVSMIPGNAYHYIESLEANDFEDFIKETFPFRYSLGRDCFFSSASAKLLFIKKLTCTDITKLLKKYYQFSETGDIKKLNNVFLFKPSMGKSVKNEDLDPSKMEKRLIAQLDDRWIDIVFEFSYKPYEKSFIVRIKSLTDLSPLIVLEKVQRELIAPTRPLASSLFAATGGIESSEQFDKLLYFAFKKDLLVDAAGHINFIPKKKPTKKGLAEVFDVLTEAKKHVEKGLGHLKHVFEETDEAEHGLLKMALRCEYYKKTGKLPDMLFDSQKFAMFVDNLKKYSIRIIGKDGIFTKKEEEPTKDCCVELMEVMEEVPEILDKTSLNHISNLILVNIFWLRQAPVTIMLSNLNFDSLPSALKFLDNVKELSLVSNVLTELPDWIGSLRNIESLDLSSNKLKSLPDWIDNLKNLTSFDLNGNKLISLPHSIGNLSNLMRLYVHSNKLGSLPDSIGRLQNLENLNISINFQLQKLPHSLKKLAKLTSLMAIQLTLLDDDSNRILDDIKRQRGRRLSMVR